MPRFIVRVELVDLALSHASYTSLHEAMRLGGFLQEILLGQTRYQLPPAEYTTDDASTNAAKVCQTVKDIASNIAKKVPTPCRVLVSETHHLSDVAQWNLDVVP